MSVATWEGVGLVTCETVARSGRARDGFGDRDIRRLGHTKKRHQQATQTEWGSGSVLG